MRRSVPSLARLGHLAVVAALLLALCVAPGLAFARAGGGGSFGSRGSRTFSAPPVTNTAPYSAQPMQRSYTQPSSPGYAAPQPGYGGGYGAPVRSGGFMSGLMGGLIGAGIGGLLFGGGLFHGVSGFGGFIGLLFQIFLLVVVGRWLLRMLFRPSAPAGYATGPGGGAYAAQPARAPLPMGGGGAAVQIQPADFQAFERLLQAVQAAWSAQDLNRLRAVATPEMVSFFSDQLSEQASRGQRNTVTDVKLEQGDLSEAWSEDGRDYATVAMRFSMVDATYDGSGRVVDGDAMVRTMATEIWTFVRARGGHWLLSGIQQTR